MSKTILLSSLLLSTLLFGCGGGSDGKTATGGSNSDDTTSDTTSDTTNKGLASIISFDVTGTSKDNQKGQAPISPAINLGKWGINWEINLKKSNTNSDLFQVSIYVSDDKVLSSTDPEIYHSLCTGNQCIGKTQLTMTCHHNSNSTPDCDDDLLGGIFQYYNLETYLKTIPKSAYFILRAKAIDGALNNELISSATHPVVFE